MGSFLSVIADFFINLAAGWVGVTVIIAPTGKFPTKVNAVLLTGNMLAAIMSLLIAIKLRSISGL